MVMNASIQRQDPVVCTCLCHACAPSELLLCWAAAFFSLLTNALNSSHKSAYYWALQLANHSFYCCGLHANVYVSKHFNELSNIARNTFYLYFAEGCGRDASWIS